MRVFRPPLSAPLSAIPALCLVRDRLVAGRGKFLDLVADHFADPLIGTPEGLADTDRMLDDLDDGRIPVLALAVVKDAVASHHEKIGIAPRESGGDRHLVGSSSSCTIAVGQINATERGQGGMLVHVVHAHAQITASAIQIERTGLKDGLVPCGYRNH